MSAKKPSGPSLRPTAIDAETWFYETKKGLEIVFRGRIIEIPWWKIMRSATRCGWTVRRDR